MRSLTLMPVLATVLSLGTAKPTPTKPEPPSKRASLPTVTMSGNAFWQGKDRFYIRGIDYQPGGSSAMADPLADPNVCKRDIAEFKKLGVNTVRVYITDNSANHDECMNELADAGIYAIIDANNPLYSLNRLDPGPSYNTLYLQSVFATIDAFIKYDNTLAFFSGNEVINDNVNSTLAAPYVKAVTRDMRQYIKSRNYRSVPVGYSAADVAQNRMQLAHYMNCGTDDERSDFFAFNDYSWCNTNFHESGWDQKVKNFTGYGIAIFLSEYGCITNGRDFGEVKALMSSDMTPVYSGGLMYEYALEDNGYGIVKIDGDKVEEQPEFKKFASALSANPAPTGDGGFTSTTKAVACPTKDANWLVDTTLLPAIPENAKKFMTDGAGTGPGLKGSGSQNAADSGTSSGDAQPGSGAASGSSSSSSENAAAPAGRVALAGVDKAPFVITGLVMLLTLTGTLLL
ncbi:6c4a97ef-3d61-433b-8566-22f8f43f90ce [Thermothielavioides terrestris]|uniref:1,3-beta-glucanosyltransferase n=1 Tax=Thermothielavioides terrestris TaxID=2587410 RepID=A0A446BHW7_9PEZI|nr:6c4a97ef-3d61-433b-8566-22f8f43f90ce [Thermothielavioides terrestris]